MATYNERNKHVASSLFNEAWGLISKEYADTPEGCQQGVHDLTDDEWSLGFTMRGLWFTLTIADGILREGEEGWNVLLQGDYYPEGLKPKDEINPRLLVHFQPYNYTEKVWTRSLAELQNRMEGAYNVLEYYKARRPPQWPCTYVGRTPDGDHVYLRDIFSDNPKLEIDPDDPLPGKCHGCGASITPNQVLNQACWSQHYPGRCPACSERMIKELEDWEHSRG